MRRLIILAVVATLLAALAPVANAHDDHALEVRIDKAPVAPDGTTAGEISDFVVTFVDRDPALPGIGLKAGATVTVTLPDEFVNTGTGKPNAAILLQGWPQSPPAPPPFPWTTTVAGNTITATLAPDFDFPVGTFGPGPKQVHLILNDFRNPHPGDYDVGIAIQPDPAVDNTLSANGTVEIIPRARRNLNVVSIFSGGGPPPPFNNPLYQTVNAGADSLDIGLYLWDRLSSVADGDVNPYLGVDFVEEGPRWSRIVQGDRTVGLVLIRAPHGARDFGITTSGPSTLGTSFATGLPVGILITNLRTDPNVTGDYTITYWLYGGNRQQVFVTTE